MATKVRRGRYSKVWYLLVDKELKEFGEEQVRVGGENLSATIRGIVRRSREFAAYKRRRRNARIDS